jgi:hypothetical protein
MRFITLDSTLGNLRNPENHWNLENLENPENLEDAENLEL